MLPHLLFVGINTQYRTVSFSSSGAELTFDQLSGGEKEIAFIIGQIERFGLKKGLLIIDEPELHLNADLLRKWMFLRNSVEKGQIWLATHSLEVVEVCGQSSSFLMEKSEEKTSAITKLSNNGLFSSLCRAVGSPAFSIEKIIFVFIEGEEELGERERLKMMTSCASKVRFVEAGSCAQVQKRLDLTRHLARASGQLINARGVVDRDWRSTEECRLLEQTGLHVLSVHEIENFFLDPNTVHRHFQNIGKNGGDYFSLLRAATDRRAGSWIYDGARTNKKFRDCPPPSTSVRNLISQLEWRHFEDGIDQKCSHIIAQEVGLRDEQKVSLLRYLIAYAKIYGKHREGLDCLWQRCQGKEVFRSLISDFGFSDRETAERAFCYIWTSTNLRPQGLQLLQAFISSG